MSDAKIVYRFRAVSRIQNKWLRRLALVLTFPLMVALNILFAVGAGITLLVAHGYVSNAGLLSSARKRWNVPLGDEDGPGRRGAAARGAKSALGIAPLTIIGPPRTHAPRRA